MSLIGTMYKQPRVFAHDAAKLDDVIAAYGDPIVPMPVIDADGPGLGPLHTPNLGKFITYTVGATTYQTPGPAAGVYIGADCDLTVVMESGNEVEFLGLKGGNFYPMAILTVSDCSLGVIATAGPNILIIY